MKISLIHPSRNRAIKAHATFTQWMFNASGDHQYEYIVSIDLDDSQKEEYQLRFSEMATVLENNNRSLVDAVNVGANNSTGDLLIVVSDDFESEKNWDRKLSDFIAQNIEGETYAIHVNDDYSFEKEPPNNHLLTIPIMSRALFDRLGYIYHPSYFSMFADNDIYEVCAQIGCLYTASDITFRHNHYTVGRSPSDMTYLRQNSESAYRLGQNNLFQRRARNFDL